MNLTTQGIDMQYETFEQAKGECLNELKNGKHDEKLDKINQQLITALTNLQVTLLKVKKLMKQKKDA